MGATGRAGNLGVVMTRSRDLTLCLTASVLLLSGLVGCTGDADPEVDPTPSTSSATETESSPTDDPTDEPTAPAVEPATGPAIRESIVSLRVPEEWVTKGDQLFTDAERAPKNEARLEKEVFGFIDLDIKQTEDSLSLDEAAREAATAFLVEGKRVEESELGGEPAFVFTKSLKAFGSTEFNIGLARGRRLVMLDFSLLGGDQRQRDAVIDSVLASWEWQQ